jgi:hypothetical protein
VKINQEVLRELQRLFPDSIKTIRVKILYTKEVNRFIKRVERAHKLTAKSKLVFRGC